MSRNPKRIGDLPFVPHEKSPQWFLDNIARPGDSHFATVDGKRVHFLAWNFSDESLPLLMFVHGFGGHAHWWSFLIPFFTDRYRVVVVDLPGMGDSDFLDEYHDECFARAILGVIREYRLAPLTLIGHSYGGLQTMYAMTLDPAPFEHGIVVDCNIWFPQQKPANVEVPVRPYKRRSSRGECMSKFSLMPPQPASLDYLTHFVSYHSCTCDKEGWSWKGDYMTRTAKLITDATLLTRIPVKVDCIFGERSLYNKDDLPDQVHRVFPNFGRLIRVKGAYHHIALDHPLELVESIKALLEN